MKRLAILTGFTLLILLTPDHQTQAQDASFVRGDSNGDQKINITDAIFTLRHLFLGQAITCQDALDVNDDGILDLSDGIAPINYLFLGGMAPAQPFPDCGKDETEDELTCEENGRCISRGYYFVGQRSSSVGEALTRFKDHIIDNLNTLNPNDDFAVAFFDRGVLQFPSNGNPVKATEENIATSIAWMDSVFRGGGTCVGKGLETVFEFSSKSDSKSKSIFLFHNGWATCPGNGGLDYLDEVLSRVKTLNSELIPIHCLYPRIDEIPQFLIDLANQSGGSYLRFLAE